MFSRFWSQTAGGLPRVFWTLWSAILVNRVGAFGMLFLPLYLSTGRGLSLTAAGLVTAGYGIGGAGGSLIGGVLADSWGRRATMVTANGIAAALMLALAFAQPLWLIAGLTLFIGIFHSMPGPATVAAIIDIVPEESRARAFNLQFWAFNLGMAIASALAGVIAEAGFFLLFALDAATTAITAYVLYRYVPETLMLRQGRPSRPWATRPWPARPIGSRPHPASGQVKRSATPGGLGTALTDPIFMVFVGLTFIAAILNSQTSILQLAMDSDGLPPAAYGIVAAVPGLLIVLGQLFVPRLIQGRLKGRVLALSLAVSGIGYFTLTFADVFGAYLMAAAIWTIGSMLAAPPNAEVIAELAPARLRARYQAVFFLTFPAAGFVAPAVGGWSLEHLGDVHWVVIGAVGLAAAAGHLLASRPRERRVARLLASPAILPNNATV
ncbi:MAG: MFS transporter [Hamadaea sp.]|nr:MFS transporter [Hamadaea sp.]NUT04798.1 MFS transporter [Hamadaea sp.]